MAVVGLSSGHTYKSGSHSGSSGKIDAPTYRGRTGLFGEIPIVTTAKQASGSPSIQDKVQQAGSITGAAANQVVDGVSSLKGALGAINSAGVVNQVSSGGAGAGVSAVDAGSGTVAAVPDYLHADLAKAYGMDATTAYQEALSNTSYQRAFKDMEAVGLNPSVIFGNRNAAAANGVAYAQMQGAGASTGVSSAKGLNSLYKTLGNIGTLIGALAGKPYVGKAIGSSIGGIMDLFTK